MGERIDKLPHWLQTTLKVLKIVGPVCGAISVIAVTYYDIRDRASQAERKSEAGYETLAPAVAQLQELLRESEDRILVLETYLEAMRDEGRYLASVEPEDEDEGEEGADEQPSAKPERMTASAMPRPPEPKAKSSENKLRPVPQKLDKAQMYQQQRVEMHCPENDPLCGL